MRRPQLLSSLACAATLLALTSSEALLAQSGSMLEACDTSNGKTSHQSNISNDDNRRIRISWSNDRCSIDMRAEGDFELERDFSDVRSMSRGGFLEIDVRIDGGERRSYEVSREGGEIERVYTVNREEQPIDEEARRWIGAMLMELERRTGFAAHTRVPDLLRNGGPNAVMDEVSRMGSDWVQRRYLSIMLDSAKLAEPDVRRALGLAGEELESDFEHASFLVDLGKREYVTTTVAGDFVKSTSHIESDFERRRALGAVLALDELPDAVVGELLRAGDSFDSDFERAELLIGAAKKHGFPNGEARDAYLKAASGIDSDFEKGRVLSRLTKEELNEDQLVALLSTAKTINSDFELANLLARIADGRSLDGRARDAYMAATETIESSFERRRALTALLGDSKRARM